jgi:hypothetical protein
MFQITLLLNIVSTLQMYLWIGVTVQDPAAHILVMESINSLKYNGN